MLQPNGKTFQLQLSMLELQCLEGIDRPLQQRTLYSVREQTLGKRQTCYFNILVVYPCLRLRITWASK